MLFDYVLEELYFKAKAFDVSFVHFRFIYTIGKKETKQE